MLRFIISLTILFTSLQTIANSSNAGSIWKVVANKEVCMVTNVHFARPQIPVEQGEKSTTAVVKTVRPRSKMTQLPESLLIR